MPAALLSPHELRDRRSATSSGTAEQLLRRLWGRLWGRPATAEVHGKPAAGFLWCGR